MNNKERIASYLSQGLKPSQVASIVNQTAGYISQLMKEAVENPDCEFGQYLKKYAEKAESEEHSEDKIITNKYMSLEHKLLNAIGDSIGYGAELPALTRTLEVIANRQEKRAQRMQAPTLAAAGIQNYIQITIPSHAVPEHVINGNKEVIQIGSQQLAPLSADGVKNLFTQIAAQKALPVPETTEF